MRSHRTLTLASRGRGSSAPTADIAAEIDATGCARIPGAVPQHWLDTVRAHVDTVSTGAHELMLEGSDATDLSFIRELVESPEVAALLHSVAQAGHPAGSTTDTPMECALRVINGADPEGRPLWFHYDASVVTMVLPIVIPDAPAGQSGELVLYPNHRPYRRWALTNVIEKAVTQSDTYRRRFLQRPQPRDVEMVSLEPGNAYLFWGYRSYHATMPVAPGTQRVTVILHYRDVHADSRVVQYAKAIRQRIMG